MTSMTRKEPVSRPQLPQEERLETIADLLLARLGDEHPGLLDGDRSWTWDEVVRESAARAAWAEALRDPAKPFHIGVLLENHPEFIFWLGAGALAGATIVGINSTRSGEYLEQEVRHTELQLVVTDAAGEQLLDGLDIGVAPERFLRIDDTTYDAQVAAHRVEPTRKPEIDASTQLLLLFTSGTTGASKAARVGQGRLVGLGYQNTAKYDITRKDISYCSMPLFHGNAVMGLWAPTLTVGGTVALTRKFSASRFIDECRAYRATYFTYVGKAIGYVLGTPARDDDADTHLTHGFGTEASPEDRSRFKERFGATLLESYGSSEGAGMVALDPDAPTSALGRPAHDGVRIVNPETREQCAVAELDEHGRVLNAEVAVGEMVNTTGAAAFEGYWKNPEADAERVRHGWFWTGDLGFIDKDGLIYFAGRSGDWIRVDSENISALLTERVLRRHEGILLAAAFAVPDPRAGDQVMAAIEIPETTRFEDLDLGAFLAQQTDLGTKGAPRFVRVSHALPSTGSNKLRKKEIQLDGWRTTDPVYAWVGRGEPTYSLMTEDDKHALIAEFDANGRRRFLP
ncbi:fatty-acyl-CoA synthase [Nocardioides daedukensis]|uniref:Fatty-acyl-CoA synthase n=1 Tax=Nocardioides daedukensis TaxID=634462 RepID=A0A7Y9S5R4_9ACTN|nr:AMP-binding protein [Nocardioides daedukensis]NYG59930.1 fatty-acyl-CoA synthase [Nocardioides daedukensis]